MPGSCCSRSHPARCSCGQGRHPVLPAQETARATCLCSAPPPASAQAARLRASCRGASGAARSRTTAGTCWQPSAMASSSGGPSICSHGVGGGGGVPAWKGVGVPAVGGSAAHVRCWGWSPAFCSCVRGLAGGVQGCVASGDRTDIWLPSCVVPPARRLPCEHAKRLVRGLRCCRLTSAMPALPRRFEYGIPAEEQLEDAAGARDQAQEAAQEAGGVH
jgi:hypothetical protein